MHFLLIADKLDILCNEKYKNIEKFLKNIQHAQKQFLEDVLTKYKTNKTNVKLGIDEFEQDLKELNDLVYALWFIEPFKKDMNECFDKIYNDLKEPRQMFLSIFLAFCENFRLRYNNCLDEDRYSFISNCQEELPRIRELLKSMIQILRYIRKSQYYIVWYYCHSEHATQLFYEDIYSVYV